MYTIGEVPRPKVPFAGAEKPQLGAWLDFYRASLVNKCAGLTLDQLAQRPVVSSELTLIGLLRHLADVELWWFVEGVAGEKVPPYYATDDDRDADFHDLFGVSLQIVERNFLEATERARSILRRFELDDLIARPARDGSPLDVRWVCHHMLEEYARHLGHADLLRELTDGATGY